MLARSKIEQCDKDKWSKVMVVSMMSSEESGEDGGDEVLIRRKLPWRAERVNHFFTQLDDSGLKQLLYEAIQVESAELCFISIMHILCYILPGKYSAQRGILHKGTVES